MPINGGTAGSALALKKADGTLVDADTVIAGQPGGAAWGGITGTLLAQTDLQAALDAKQVAGSYATAAQGAKADTALQNVSTAWPVGAVFISVVSTNPATLLGFGTWSAFGAGRVLVGLDSGDTDFDTVEETGGVKTVTLTAAQSGLPQHTHTQNSHNHTQDAHNHTQNSFAPRIINSGTAGTVGVQGASAASNANASNAATTATNQAATATNQAATATNQDAGPTAASQAHTNVQPYIVVYMWKRTA